MSHHKNNASRERPVTIATPLSAPQKNMMNNHVQQSDESVPTVQPATQQDVEEMDTCEGTNACTICLLCSFTFG